MSHILVIEDDDNNARLFELILKRKGGFDVTATCDVENLFKYIEESGAAIVLMDVSLAGARYQGEEADGIMLTKILKTDERTAQLPVVLVTAHAMSGDRERLLNESGADGYITKPITDPQALIDTVNSLIN